MERVVAMAMRAIKICVDDETLDLLDKLIRLRKKVFGVEKISRSEIIRELIKEAARRKIETYRAMIVGEV